MRFLLCGILLMGAAFLNLTCATRGVSSRSETVMGVLGEIVIVGKTAAEREKILDHAFQILRGLEAQMSLHRETSEVTRINHLAYGEAQEISDDTFEVIRQSLQFYEISGGVFDITIYPLMKLWGFYGRHPEIPRHEKITEVLRHVGSRRLILNAETKSVRFRVSGMGVDMGGIAKGYACDRVAAYLKREKVSNALINLGSTVYGLGRSPDGSRWKIGIQHPRDAGGILQIITLKDQAVATSGDYQQFFLSEGKRYAHILDPRTGYPSEASAAVSVIAPSAALADVLSTCFFILGPEEGKFLAAWYPEARGIHTGLTQDGQMVISEF